MIAAAHHNHKPPLKKVEDALHVRAGHLIICCVCSIMDTELQQRAVEYQSLEQRPAVAHRNLTSMPPWEKRKSLLLRRFAQREVGH